MSKAIFNWNCDFYFWYTSFCFNNSMLSGWHRCLWNDPCYPSMIRECSKNHLMRFNGSQDFFSLPVMEFTCSVSQISIFWVRELMNFQFISRLNLDLDSDCQCGLRFLKSGLEIGVENLWVDTISCCVLWRMILTHIGNLDNWSLCAWHHVSQTCPHYRPHIRWFHWDQKGECHVITFRVSCHVIFAMACHNRGGAVLMVVFITVSVCKQAAVRKRQHCAWRPCRELWAIWNTAAFLKSLRLHQFYTFRGFQNTNCITSTFIFMLIDIQKYCSELFVLHSYLIHL